MTAKTRCPECEGTLDDGRCPRCAPSKADRTRKTVVVPAVQSLQDLASPEPAGEALAEVPIPDGWEVSLDALEGPSEGTTFQVRRSRMLIGRGDVDVRLADRTISRTHASLEVYGGTCVLLKDLGSTNGTYVNGQRVRIAELEDGDEIRIGRSRLVVTIAAPP